MGWLGKDALFKPAFLFINKWAVAAYNKEGSIRMEG
jgi:hypothetical protein